MTKRERQVKKYIDAWCEGKRVQYWNVPRQQWIDEEYSIDGVLYSLYSGYKLRIVRGQRG